MREFTKAQKARHAVREFKTLTDASAIRGFYRPCGKMGKALEQCLRNLSPEIYGSMNDPRIVELKGLEYVIDRLPKGIEECNRIILTEEDPFKNDVLKPTIPLKRRRTCYRVGQNEMCFVITRGLSEIYDILTHMTFLVVEARKIHSRMTDDSGNLTIEWSELEKSVGLQNQFSDAGLDQALWSLSIILGRPYQETRDAFHYLEANQKLQGSNNGLFHLIHSLGQRIEAENKNRNDAIIVYLTPSLMRIIGQQEYEKKWAADIKAQLIRQNLHHRPIHIVSANLHSVLNVLYGFAALHNPGHSPGSNLYDFFHDLRQHQDKIENFAAAHGFLGLPDRSGAHIDCQIIDTYQLNGLALHPELDITVPESAETAPVILVIDYAFGAQAFEIMENLLESYVKNGSTADFNYSSISIMGKAGILTGDKGDIMLATAHVFEGTSDNYRVDNDLSPSDFPDTQKVFAGPMVTVLGTSLQNRDMLEKFQTDWQTIGLEMEGGHFQRAISAAIIKGNAREDMPIRYAYYASDNPIKTGSTLAAGAMGKEGVKPTYLITKVILEKILSNCRVLKSIQ
ncbi:DUF6909 family protein [Desulfosarcina sp.]|uniref:DUF6909 family protein n=1 Tax=Desulfosarcina sp. TaxID=2027861 RepID=UPI0039708C87